MKAKLMFVLGLFLTLGIVLPYSFAAEKSFIYGESSHLGAKAEVSIESSYSGYGKTIKIQTQGLNPLSVYTVWFVKETPKMSMAGVGRKSHDFRSDDEGIGFFSAEINTSDIKKWKILKIVLHKDGNPKNMDKANLVSAFVTSIKEIYRAPLKAPEMPTYKISREKGSYSNPKVSPEASSH